MKVRPEDFSASIDPTPAGLSIVIPCKRNWFAILFLAFWLCGWAFGEVMVTVQLFRGQDWLVSLFMLAWLGGWTVGGGFAIYTLAMSVVGKEIIILDGATLSVRADAFGIGRTLEYDVAHMSNLRTVAGASPPQLGQFWQQGFGTVRFDYGAKTFGFGRTLEEAEGARIVNAIASVQPGLIAKDQRESSGGSKRGS